MRYKIINVQPELMPAELAKALRKHLQSYQFSILDRLATGRDHWSWYLNHSDATRKEFILAHFRNRPNPSIAAKLLSDQITGEPVDAIILDGRWVARCPDCCGQEVVDPKDPVFTCLSEPCYNASNGHYPRPVRFPKESIQKELSEILLARPNPINRNYDPNGIFGVRDSIASLRQENKEHGIPESILVRGE